MKMFLTRLGFKSKMIITGDISQIDLPKGVKSGLVEAINILGDIKEIGITIFSKDDVIRHLLVAKILAKYEQL
jgi:phosphate starvation-inducible PhoH-like protein